MPPYNYVFGGPIVVKVYVLSRIGLGKKTWKNILIGNLILMKGINRLYFFKKFGTNVNIKDPPQHRSSALTLCILLVI